VATVTNKGKVLSLKEKVKIIGEIEKKKSRSVSGIWFRKFCNQKDLEKQNQNC
jgi:hypothetical protein